MTPLRLLVLCLVATSSVTLAFTNVLHSSKYKHSTSRITQGRQKLITITNAIKTNLDDTNYKQTLFADSYDKAVLVDAYAPWCGPCKLIEPMLEKVATKWQDSLDLVKYDVEASKNPNLKLELLMQNAMPRGLPCLLLFMSGKVVTKHSGVITEEELDSLLEEHIEQQTTSIAAPTLKTTQGFVSMAHNDASDDYMLS